MKPRINFSLLGILLFATLVAAVDLGSCLRKYREGSLGPHVTGGTDGHGRPVDREKASALSYTTCRELCGTGSAPFKWADFSRQFTTWLLPWLALVSQLPYGSSDRQDNLVAMALMLGSPVLSAYSLLLTVLGGAYAHKLFDTLDPVPRGHNLPKVASYLLTSLFQFPIHVLELERNNSDDQWWKALARSIDCEHTWSLAAFASLAWVVIAYVFTLVDAFSARGQNNQASLVQSIGFMWIWLFPVVVGWLQISPKCDDLRMRKNMESHKLKPPGDDLTTNAEKKPIEPVSSPPARTEDSKDLLQDTEDALQGIKDTLPVMDINSEDGSGSRLENKDVGPKHGLPFQLDLIQPSDLALPDEGCSPPIYNYARFLCWMHSVHHAATIYGTRVGRASETGSGELQVAIAWRMLIASFGALSLHWLTAGSAIISAWYTPTIGLGCRSGSYILFAAVSSLVWLLMVLSNIIAYNSLPSPPRPRGSKTGGLGMSIAFGLSRLAKVIALLNAVWIFTVCVLLFSGVLNSCWCYGSVLYWGRLRSYVVIDLTNNLDTAFKVRAGGVVLSSAAVLLFIGFIKSFRHIPPKKIDIDY